RRLEKHRARSVSLESAHGNLALLEGYRVAAGVETIDAERAHPGQDAASVTIHDLLGLQFFHWRRVFPEQCGASRKDERDSEPSLARADDATTGQTPHHVDSVFAVLGRSAKQMIAADRDEAARRRVDEQERRCLACGDRVEKVEFEADEIIGGERRGED